MGMVVRTNMAAINANNSLQQTSKAQQSGMQKLASGFKINKAADDASGLAISEKMKNQIKALDTAKDNCEDGANMIQTAEGYMSETHDMLNRMVELAEKAANGTLGDEDRKSLQDEMDQLCGEIDRIATTANFNGHKLLDGSIGSNGQIKLSNVGNEIKASVSTAGSSTHAVETGAVAANNMALTDELTLKANQHGLQLSKDAGTANTYKFYMNSKGDIMDVNTANTKIYTADTYNDTSNKNGWDEITVVTEAKADTVVNKDGIKLQIGESSTAADKLEVSINSFHTDSLFAGINGFINSTNNSTDTAATAAVQTVQGNASSTYTNAYTVKIDNQDSASAAADAIRQISKYVSDERGKLGAQQNRLEHTVNNLTTASENTSAANSRIRDTDMAKEMMQYTSKNVIAQAAQSMLAQANSQPQNVLSLLQ